MNRMNRKTITGVFFLALLCVVPISMCAKSPYVFQSENPKANFAWDENDTTRYEGHYRFENAYQLIEDMLSDKCPLDFADAVFAVENCMYEGALDYSAYRMELERISNGVKQMAGSILFIFWAISCWVLSVTFCPNISNLGVMPKNSQPPSLFRNAHRDCIPLSSSLVVFFSSRT